jgi:hypothetical protein
MQQERLASSAGVGGLRGRAAAVRCALCSVLAIVVHRTSYILINLSVSHVISLRSDFLALRLCMLIPRAMAEDRPRNQSESQAQPAQPP